MRVRVFRMRSPAPAVAVSVRSVARAQNAAHKNSHGIVAHEKLQR